METRRRRRRRYRDRPGAGDRRASGGWARCHPHGSRRGEGPLCQWLGDGREFQGRDRERVASGYLRDGRTLGRTRNKGRVLSMNYLVAVVAGAIGTTIFLELYRRYFEQ